MKKVLIGFFRLRLTKILLLFLTFSASTLWLSAQEVNRVLSDGLSLAYYLYSNKLDAIDEYVKDSDFKINSEATTAEYKSYYKKLSLKKDELMCMAVDKRNPNQQRVAFYHVDVEGESDFIARLKERLDEHVLFKYMEDKDIYFFFVPNVQTEGQVGSEAEQDRIGYIAGIKVTDVAVWFYTPQLVEYEIPWEEKFPTLVRRF